MKKIKVLFVCMGNICRSPMAEGVFRHLVREAGLEDRIETDSAGTHAYHVSQGPDPRAIDAAAARGVDISDLRARKAVAEDFERFDYVIAMDESNRRKLESLSQPSLKEKLQLFLEYAQGLTESEVPDPYYGGPRGFERVLDMVEIAADGLLEDVCERHLAS